MSAPTVHGWLKLDTHSVSRWKPKPYGPIVKPRPARVEEAPVGFCRPAFLSAVVNKDSFKSSQAGLSACNSANKAEARCLDRLSYPVSSEKTRCQRIWTHRWLGKDVDSVWLLHFAEGAGDELAAFTDFFFFFLF